VNAFVFIVYKLLDIKAIFRTACLLEAMNAYFDAIEQCFSTFVRTRPGKFFFFIRRGPGPNKFTRKYLSNFFLSSYIKLA